MGFCNRLDIPRQDIHTLPLIRKDMCIIDDVQVYPFFKFKDFRKNLIETHRSYVPGLSGTFLTSLVPIFFTLLNF